MQQPRSIAFALALTWLLAALPVWLVDVVPMIDYPAHLARVTLLSNLPLDPTLARFWTVTFPIVPNLAMDLVVPALAPLVGATAGLKLFMTVSLGLWILGSAMIQRALWGSVGVPMLAAAAFALNASYANGFLNFHFGIGLALCAAGLWLARPARSPLFLALMAVVGVVLLTCHLMALAIFGLIVGGIEIGRWLRDGVTPGRVVGSAVHGVLVMLPAALIWLFLVERGDGGAIRFAWPQNALALLVYSSRLGGIDYNAAPVLALIAAAALAWRKGVLRIAPVMLPPLALLTLAMLLSPSEALGGTVIHVRLAAVVAIVALASIRIDLTPGISRLAAAGIIAVLAAGAVSQTLIWRPRSIEIAAFRASVARDLPKGLRMASAVIDQRRDVAYSHAGDLAILDAQAFVPDFFTTPGQSTMRLTPDFRRIGASNAIDGAVPSADEIAMLVTAGDRIRLDAGAQARLRPYLTFACDFDALAIFGPRPDGFAMPEAFTPVASSRDTALYRVTPPANCPPR